MLRFEFEARGLRTAGDGVLIVEIQPPRPVSGFPDDFECQIRFSGVFSKEMRGVGAFTLQAVDLSVQIVKAVMTSYGAEWEFWVNGQGPVTFEY